MTAAAWNMSSAAFNNNELTENGRALLRHMGEHVAITAAPLTHVAATSAPLAQGTDTCTLQALLVADDSTRDEQSAASFASGFFPPSCAHARREAIVVANETNGLRAATSDSDTALCDEPVNEATLEERFGSTAFLTDLYQPQIRRVSEVLGCCSAALCREYGLDVVDGANCTIDELPYTFVQTYYRGYYDGPLSAAAAFAQTWMLQTLSGVSPVAYGELSMREIEELYAVHVRLMWLGSNLNRSTAAGSHLLGFILASLEQLVPAADGGPGAPLPGAAPGAPPFVALFAHDFNLLYVRTLLAASWLTDTYPFNAATTGSSISFELHRVADGAASTAAYRVRGVLEAATVNQQQAATPLVPPHAPPSRSVFLDMPLDDFRTAVLGALEPRCVSLPLRATLDGLRGASTQQDASFLQQIEHSALAVAIGVLLLLAGCVFGFLAGRAHRMLPRGMPLLDPKPPDVAPFALQHVVPLAAAPGPAAAEARAPDS